MLNQTFARRFNELEAGFDKLPRKANVQGSGTNIPTGDWKQWATSAQSLIRAVFGDASPHYSNFVKTFDDCRGYTYEVEAIKGVFLSAKQDFEGGYVFNVDLRVSGEVFGSFVALAKTAMSEGNKDVAAVLACAALEDALKRYALVNGLQVEEKGMNDVIGGLKAAGLVGGAQKTLLDAMPRVRNFAMHADWAKISEPEVNSVIGFVEQFLLAKFSSD